ncbi:MAG: hypothetical protein MHM6MM_003505 [Cercozoa sp. M6MM]
MLCRGGSDAAWILMADGPWPIIESLARGSNMWRIPMLTVGGAKHEDASEYVDEIPNTTTFPLLYRAEGSLQGDAEALLEFAYLMRWRNLGVSYETSAAWKQKYADDSLLDLGNVDTIDLFVTHKQIRTHDTVPASALFPKRTPESSVNATLSTTTVLADESARQITATLIQHGCDYAETDDSLKESGAASFAHMHSEHWPHWKRRCPKTHFLAAISSNSRDAVLRLVESVAVSQLFTHVLPMSPSGLAVFLYYAHLDQRKLTKWPYLFVATSFSFGASGMPCNISSAALPKKLATLALSELAWFRAEISGDSDEQVDAVSAVLAQALLGVIGIASSAPKTALKEEFGRVSRHFPGESDTTPVTSFSAAAAFDIVSAALTGLDRELERNSSQFEVRLSASSPNIVPRNTTDGAPLPFAPVSLAEPEFITRNRRISAAIQNMSISGLIGDLSFDETGTRKHSAQNWHLFSFQPDANGSLNVFRSPALSELHEAVEQGQGDEALEQLRARFLEAMHMRVSEAPEQGSVSLLAQFAETSFSLRVAIVLLNGVVLLMTCLFWPWLKDMRDRSSEVKRRYPQYHLVSCLGCALISLSILCLLVSPSYAWRAGISHGQSVGDLQYHLGEDATSEMRENATAQDLMWDGVDSQSLRDQVISQIAEDVRSGDTTRAGSVDIGNLHAKSLQSVLHQALQQEQQQDSKVNVIRSTVLSGEEDRVWSCAACQLAFILIDLGLLLVVLPATLKVRAIVSHSELHADEIMLANAQAEVGCWNRILNRLWLGREGELEEVRDLGQDPAAATKQTIRQHRRRWWQRRLLMDRILILLAVTVWIIALSARTADSPVVWSVSSGNLDVSEWSAEQVRDNESLMVTLKREGRCALHWSKDGNLHVSVIVVMLLQVLLVGGAFVNVARGFSAIAGVRRLFQEASALAKKDNSRSGRRRASTLGKRLAMMSHAWLVVALGTMLAGGAHMLAVLSHSSDDVTDPSPSRVLLTMVIASITSLACALLICVPMWVLSIRMYKKELRQYAL